MSKKRIYISTYGKYGGYKRQLAWFSRHDSDLYFDVGGFFLGCHTSYHKDGNIFRTNPITESKAKLIGKNMTLNEFDTWHQFGTTMISKDSIFENPCLKERNIRKAVRIEEIDLNEFPSNTINLVVEILNPKMEYLLNLEHLAPPPDSKTIVIDDIDPYIVITVLGHNHNLLLKPINDGFEVAHINSRFSTNRKGITYNYEAIGH